MDETLVNRIESDGELTIEEVLADLAPWVLA